MRQFIKIEESSSSYDTLSKYEKSLIDVNDYSLLERIKKEVEDEEVNDERDWHETRKNIHRIKVEQNEQTKRRIRGNRSADNALIKKNQKYEFGRIISHGMIGIVYIAREAHAPQKWIICIKSMLIDRLVEKNLLSSLYGELEILHEVKKIKGCIRLLEFFYDQTTIKLVFPYYSNGDLYRIIKQHPGKQLPEHRAQNIFKQLVRTVSKLHQKDIIHRDLKPENILLDDNDNIVIIDFGFAIKKSDPRLKAYPRVGTLDFYAYELLNPTGPDGKKIVYDERIDIWCLGIILYEMLYGITPFFSKNDEKVTKDRIRRLDFSFPHNLYPNVETLIRRILTHPDERITLKGIMRSPWYRQCFIID